MNLPNKITMLRMFLSFVILIILLVPWSMMGMSFPVYLLNETLIDMKYIFVGILFLIASFSDFLDGYYARKLNLITDFGKTMDAIADKVLVNGILIILAYNRLIPLIVPVVIITRDLITDSCKSVCGSKGKVVAASALGKWKTATMMIGIVCVLFYNYPFMLIGLDIGRVLLLIACVLSVTSGVEYVKNSLPYLKEK